MASEIGKNEILDKAHAVWYNGVEVKAMTNGNKKGDRQMATTKIDVDSFCSRYEDMTSAVSRKYTDDVMTHEDFMQECWMKLLEVYRTAEGNGAVKDVCSCGNKAVMNIGAEAKPVCLDCMDVYVRCTIMNTVRGLFKRGHNLRMKTRDRRAGQQQVRTATVEADAMALEARPNYPTRIPDAAQLRRVIRLERIEGIMSRLNPVDKAVFEQMQEPGDIAFAAAVADCEAAKAKQAAGKLAMNVDKVVIRKKHIALQLGLSPATISRAFANIEEARPVKLVN